MENQPRVCNRAGCDTVLVRKGPGPFPTYCCALCKTRAWEEANPERHRGNWRRRAEGKKKPDVPCPYCAAPMRPHLRACPTSECQRLKNNERQRDFQAKHQQRTGVDYYRTRFADQRRAHRRARRALERDAFDELVRPEVVYERDNWTCGICHGRIDPAVSSHDRWGKTIDHKVPLARGGRHSYANVQAAHMGCNSGKNARVTTA